MAVSGMSFATKGAQNRNDSVRLAGFGSDRR
jgi:hypothetical protein